MDVADDRQLFSWVKLLLRLSNKVFNSSAGGIRLMNVLLVLIIVRSDLLRCIVP